jgi:acyl-CoA hydrolase
MGRPLVVLADGPGTPELSPLAAARDLAGDADLLLGWTVQRAPWLNDLAVGSTRSVMGGYALTEHISRGAVAYLPVRIASMPRLLRGPLQPDVLVVRGRPRGAGYQFTTSVGWAHAAAAAAGQVLVLVDEDAPDLGAPAIPGNVVAGVPCRFLDQEPAVIVATPEERAIGGLVASLIPEGAVIQYGPGGIGNSVVAALEAPVRVWSGLATDALVGLASRGLLQGRASATYMWGGAALSSMASAGDLVLRPVEETHDMGSLTQLDRFVAVNTAVQVGLDGSVNVERVAGRLVAGIGGHADFCAAAAFNPTGLSVIAVRSQHKGRSTIVSHVEVVSTARTDVDVVVTEHGIAWLRDADDDERARRLIAVAAPEHREELSAGTSARKA